MHSLFLLGLLVVARPQAPSPPAAPKAAAVADDLTAEVQRAVTAYNARDLSYYESVLDPKSVYIAEDGAVISGRERVLRTFGRIFTADPPRRIEISDLSVDRRGDSGWATFRWTLTAGTDVRQGVTSVLYLRSDGGWRPMLIQNTLRGHAMRPAAAGSPSPSPSPR
ncbi:MAG TPA: nuclear transport factor 2 family protein, partial [Vicinamibacteria bacterium]|nr:nuclear transport factor 2 family protein [Vicinamibacteria bacterium]